MFKLFQRRKASTSHPILQVVLARKIKQMFLNFNKGRQALLDLQVQLHILQIIMTTQEIKCQTLNLQLTDYGHASMTFQGFLSDPIDHLDNVYNLISTCQKSKHIWEDAQGMTGIVDGIEDYIFLPKSVSVSPSHILHRMRLPMPASTTWQHSIYLTSTVSRASVSEVLISSRSHHNPCPPIEYYSALPPSASSSSRASETSSHQHSCPSADYYSTRPPSTTLRAPISKASTRIHYNPCSPTTHHSMHPPSAASSTRASETSSHHNNHPPSATPSSKTSVKPGPRSNGNVYKVPKLTK